MIGSITKLFTGMLIIILNDKNMLDINDNVNKYIEPNEHNNFKNVTINHLLNHTGGIIWYLAYKDIPSEYIKVDSSTEALRIFMKKPLCTGQIGTKKYSSMGFIILGAIIEKVTNQSYMDALKYYILHPCNMYNTNIGEPNISLYNNYVLMNKSKIKEEQMEKYMVNAGGGLYSCVADMFNFAKNILKILTPLQIKRCYGFYEKNTIKHGGYIYGGKAKFKVEYTNKWKIKNIVIELETWTEYDY
jgi:CubicO group peptidase (beta-lactamase class C family)